MIETIVFGGGCFWCTEAVFKMLKGVKTVQSGYTGGTIPNPTYEQVRTGKTGHAESIKIDYDPAQIKLRDLLTVFFGSHDPTTMNRQGADVGTQYRSVIFTTSDEQINTVKEFLKEAQNDLADPIVTTVEPLGEFYPAETYHQDYYKKNSDAPYCTAVIDPKLAKVKQKFHSLLKEKSA